MRENNFSEVQRGVRLLNYIIQRERSQRIQSCVISCTINPLCLSINFCEPNLCELNSISIHDARTDQHVSDSTFCVFEGMKTTDRANCVEDFDPMSFKNIEDDENPGLCEINRKRLDSEWGPWQEEQKQASNSLTRTFTRNCSVVAHGGVDGCEGKRKEVEQEWMQFHRGRPWAYSSAKYLCESTGMLLWGAIDGSYEQIRMVSEYFDFEPFILG